MIRNESEYQQAIKRIEEEKTRLAEHCKTWKKQGFTTKQIKNLKEPLESFHMQLVEEVESYERLKRGQFDEFENFDNIGQILIGLRIARGMKQRELADLLGVSETLVSRDERNEYHGITVERVKKIFDVLGARVVSHVEVNSMPNTAA
ncbi:MAG TPA: transcriptional regulator [Phycisphaerales bacterium]|nr:transcriptional regulator [Phycisphaerales bacterium]HCD31063.1 transcriptional regulator [Phycisphaerales bacterium]|tara:strand:+ start:1571 stop:2014 length:444 start_codon:yes stop_codon:yes gene_type:complete